MPVPQCLLCKCIKMSIEEGQKENEYDFAEDAIEFEDQLAAAKNVTFTQPLAQPLAVGSYIVCTGTPHADLPWFALNIGSGDVDSGKADIAVHFNVRTPQCYVVRNTRKGEKWGPEETTSFRRFPFKAERPFTLEVVIDSKATLFAVDGAHYCSYEHRTPAPFTAAWVQATGLRDAAITVATTDVYPRLAPPMPTVPKLSSIEAPLSDKEPTWMPNVTALLEDGIPDGYQLVINARLRPMLHSFTVDLLESGQEWPAPDIVLHVNLRAYVEASLSRQLLVLNSKKSGSWGQECRQRTARLIPGTDTTLQIALVSDSWQVWAGSLLLGALPLRGGRARALRLRGDLHPHRVYLAPHTLGCCSLDNNQ